MNVLLFIEAKLRYWTKYHARMGQFRPIRNMSFMSQITGKCESLKNIISRATDWEILVYQGETDVFWDINPIQPPSSESLEFSNEEEFCNHFKPQIDSLCSLAHHVAALYNVGRHCLCCRVFCNDKYCSEKCKNAIPCDRCARNRLPHNYDLSSSVEQDDRDTLLCKFCKDSSEPPTFSLDILVILVFKTMPEIVKKACGEIYECSQCDQLFMHSDREQEKCYLCCAPCELS